MKPKEPVYGTILWTRVDSLAASCKGTFSPLLKIFLPPKPKQEQYQEKRTLASLSSTNKTNAFFRVFTPFPLKCCYRHHHYLVIEPISRAVYVVIERGSVRFLWNSLLYIVNHLQIISIIFGVLNCLVFGSMTSTFLPIAMSQHYWIYTCLCFNNSQFSSFHL